MPLLNPVSSGEKGQALGWDSNPNAAGIQPGFVADARNCVPSHAVGYVKRGGTTNVLNTPWTSPITSMARWVHNGAQHVLIAGAGNVAYVTPTLSITSLTTGRSNTAREAFVQPSYYPMWFNGSDDPQVTDGTVVRDLGLPAPTAAITVSGPVAGGNLTPGAAYYWFYTYVIEVNGLVYAESSPSPISAEGVTTATNKTFNLTYTPAPSVATHVYIYRTVGNGDVPFLEQRITAPGSGSATSSVADTLLLSRVLEDDNTQLKTIASEARWPVVAQNRLFVVVDDDTVRWSKIGQSGSMYESFEVKSFAKTGGLAGTSDKIVGTGLAGDIPIIFKERSIGRLDAVGAVVQGAADPVLYEYREIQGDVGGVGPFSRVSVNNECVFLTRSGIMATDGRVVRNVAPTLVSYFKKLSFTPAQIQKLSAVNDTTNKRVIFSVFTSAGQTVPNTQLVGDYRYYPDFRWTYFGPGENATTNPGIRAAAFVEVDNASTGVRQVWASDATAGGAGRILLLDSGETDVDNSSGTPVARNISMRIVTRAYELTTLAQVKLFKLAVISALQKGGTTGLEVCSIYDLSDKETECEIFASSTNVENWDVALWDSGTWFDSVPEDLRYNPHTKAKYQQLVFKQADSVGITIYNWELVASQFTVR
jgi:phage terminase large subunit-like protein